MPITTLFIYFCIGAVIGLIGLAINMWLAVKDVRKNFNNFGTAEQTPPGLILGRTFILHLIFGVLAGVSWLGVLVTGVLWVLKVTGVLPNIL